MAQKLSNIFINYILKHLPTTRTFYLVTLISLTLSFLWMQSNYQSDFMILDDSVQPEIIKNVASDARYAEVYRKSSKLSKDVKYILLWTRKDYAPFAVLGNGQEGFLKSKCSQINCYVTADRYFFNGDLSKFHAVAFNGRNIRGLSKKGLPKERWPHQKYIFFNMESADNYPVCSEDYDDFFNWTATYKLDSDIPFSYILIKNADGKDVGPHKDMTWINKTVDIKEEILNKVKNRTKAAAWFVSNCNSKSDRMRFFKTLKKALKHYGLKVDVYGKCGQFKCPRNKQTECGEKLEREYFFYLSLENSFSEDYVTEKLLTALQHHVVPIVYGGANYSRFLPPKSYLNAANQPVTALAKVINDLIHDPVRYQEYLRWTSHYSYHDPSEFEDVCAVCHALHSDMYDLPSTYKHFRSWWNPDHESVCASMFTKIRKSIHSKFFGPKPGVLTTPSS